MSGYRPRQYVDNAQLTASVAAWVIAARAADAAGSERPAIPDDVGTALLKIADGVLRKSYRLHPQRDDMASFAIMTACDVLDQFDPDQTNAFAWLTTVIHRACGRYLTIEDTQKFHTLVYARIMTDHHGARCQDYLAEHQETIDHHEGRLATIREKRAEERAAKPKKPRKLPKGNLLLPSGEMVTANQLAKRLGVISDCVYRRLKAGRSVTQILEEFGGLPGQ